MTAFVLVHGAWHGGWCWQRVRDHLVESGEHRVYTPTLTGMADRSHLLGPQVDLDTHIADIANLIRWEDLSDVVLCGHSYGGMVVTGVAHILPDAVHALVYLDAFVPRDGNSVSDLSAVPDDGGEQTAAPPAAWFGLRGDDGAFVDSKLTTFPAAASRQAIRIDNEAVRSLPTTYVLAKGWQSHPHFHQNYERAQAEPTWSALSVVGSHDLMIDRPSEVAAVLLQAAAG